MVIKKGGNRMLKLLILGGGPGGLAAAIEASKLGYDTTLVEKGEIGDNIRCAEGFFDEAKLLQKPKAGVRFKVEEMIVKAKRIHRINTKGWNLWMIDRRQWQRDLAKRAKNFGAKIIENTTISPEDIKILKKDYDHIIDASGAPSITSRAYDFSDFYPKNCGKTIQYVIKGDFSHLYKKIKVGLIPDFWGYYWIFPKGKNEANVGVGNFYKSYPYKLRSILNNVLKLEGLQENGYNIIKQIGGICTNKIPKKLVYDNILLIGDAAGLTSPFHGGGVDMAIISGRIAVKAIYNETSYKEKLQQVLSRRLSFDEGLSDIWKNLSFEKMDRMVAMVSKFKLYMPFCKPKLLNPLYTKFLARIFSEKPAAF